MTNQVRIGLGVADVIGDKRDTVFALADIHGTYNVRIFGSVARGEANIDSDVDFTVGWRWPRW